MHTSGNTLMDDDFDSPPFCHTEPHHLFTHSKKFSNLAALDCYATIEGITPYQKTYQDKLDVSHLVGDMFQANKSFNLDKIFIE